VDKQPAVQSTPMLRSLLNHWRTALGLLVFNVAAWGTFRVTFMRSSQTLWQDQMGLWQSLLVADTLLVIWWYTDVTANLARTADKQLFHASVSERIRHKPFAVVVRVPLTNDGYEYCVRNVGPGLAVSVWWAELAPNGQVQRRCLGALGPGDSRTLPDDLLRELCDQEQSRPFALLAEGLWTRTSQWTGTVNLRGQGRGADVSSQFVAIPDREGETPIEALLHVERATISMALAQLQHPPNPSAT